MSPSGYRLTGPKYQSIRAPYPRAREAGLPVRATVAAVKRGLSGCPLERSFRLAQAGVRHSTGLEELYLWPERSSHA